MRKLGSFFISIGILLMSYALFTMDTSVAVNIPEGMKYDSNFPERVVNIELLAERQNYLTASSVLIVVGLLLCFVPQHKQEQISKKCPQCAEKINPEAKVCRYCNHKFEDVIMQEEFSSKIDEKLENKAIHLGLSEHSDDLNNLHKLIIKERKRFLGGYSKPLTDMLQNICKTKDETLVVIYLYKKTFNSDLIEDVMKLSTNTDSIKRNLEVFLDFDIIENKYPHKRKTSFV